MTGMTYVFSWDEPEDAMPSNYVAPVNTGTSSQIKYGDLSAPVFRDTANGDYYLDPADTSNLEKIIQLGAITTKDSGSTVTTLDYVSNFLSESTNVQFYWRTGDQCVCDYADIIIGRNWQPEYHKVLYYYVSGVGATYVYRTSLAGFAANPPFCTTQNNPTGVFSLAYANNWDAVLCAKIEPPENPLHQGDLIYSHSEEQCSSKGGEVLTVEDSIKICRFTASACPSGWLQYKNWTKTAINSGGCNGYYVYTTNHDWSNVVDPSVSYCKRTTFSQTICGVSTYCNSDGGWTPSIIGVPSTIIQSGCY